MNYLYLFQNELNNEKHYYKLIIVKQISKYKYTLELFKKTTEQIQDINSLKLGCFLYIKNNEFRIYDARNYVIKEFNEPAKFLFEGQCYGNISQALIDIFHKKNDLPKQYL